MAKNHKGSHRRSLSVALGAGATVLALVLAPISAAYLFQASVVSQNFGVGGPGGPQNMTKQFKKEIDKANKLITTLEKLDFSACEKYEELNERFEELRMENEELADSYEDLDSKEEIAKAKEAFKAAKRTVDQAKKDAKKAFTACKKPLTKVMTSLRSLRAPIDLQETMEVLMSCKRGEGCSDLNSAIDTLKEDITSFVEEQEIELEEALAQQEEEKANRSQERDMGNMNTQRQYQDPNNQRQYTRDENSIINPDMMPRYPNPDHLNDQRQYPDPDHLNDQRKYPDPDFKPVPERTTNDTRSSDTQTSTTTAN